MNKLIILFLVILVFVIYNSKRETYACSKLKYKDRLDTNLTRYIKHIKLSNFRTVINGYLPKNNQPQSPSQPKFKELLKLSKKDPLSSLKTMGSIIKHPAKFVSVTIIIILSDFPHTHFSKAELLICATVLCL